MVNHSKLEKQDCGLWIHRLFVVKKRQRQRQRKVRLLSAIAKNEEAHSMQENNKCIQTLNL